MTTTTQKRRWQPSFPERWRHGGWYTNNRYDDGASGCVHNNHIDCPGKKWFVAVFEDELGGFSTRTEAAYAERCMILEDRLENAIAPDMLDALKEAELFISELPKPNVRKDFSGLLYLEQTVKAVRSAIAKATNAE